jgi:NADH:ubiquinone oxidoreductase subunit 4 (subunit M)
MLAHGATSSAIFLIAFLMYQASGSRRLLLTKGILGWTSVLPLMWFLILIANIAAPPSYNLAAELLIIVRLRISRKLNILLVIAVILIGTRYVLVIYRSTSQGSVINFHSMAVTTQISTLSIFNHLVWSFLIIVATEVVRV